MCSISCVILNYNDADTTIKLLLHIKDFQLINDIVVVDNCSKDDSFSRLKKYEGVKVHVLQTGRNGGYGAGNNYGIIFAHEKLHSDYTIIANPDTEFEEDCVVNLLSCFDKDVGVVAPMQNGVAYARKDTSILGYVFSTSLIFDVGFGILNYPKSFYVEKDWVPVHVVQGSMLMVDTKKMMQFGMYDENIFLYFEEQTLGEKMKHAGLKTILSLRSSYKHKHHVSISKTYSKWSHQHAVLLKSAEYFMKEYKKANALQLALAKLFFLYTRLEYFFYDLFRLVMPKRSTNDF